METVKEKLAKLVKMGLNRCGEYAGTFDDSSCSGCGYREEIDCLTARVVDALIEGGVTIQEWVSVDERLPEDGSSVFVMLTHTYESDYVTYGIARYIDTSNGERHWCEDHHGYLEWDKYSDGRGGCSSYKVTRWMPIPVIPELPKGVQ